LRCHLETSGAQPLTGEFDWITLSPKSYQPPLPDCYQHIQELKVVIAQPEDLEWAEAQSERVAKGIPLYLQPEWSSVDIFQQVFNYILANPQWRLSLQIHKYLGVR
jgi:organic radical activating enzyme